MAKGSVVARTRAPNNNKTTRHRLDRVGARVQATVSRTGPDRAHARS